MTDGSCGGDAGAGGGVGTGTGAGAGGVGAGGVGVGVGGTGAGGTGVGGGLCLRGGAPPPLSGEGWSPVMPLWPNTICTGVWSDGGGGLPCAYSKASSTRTIACSTAEPPRARSSRVRVRDAMRDSGAPTRAGRMRRIAPPGCRNEPDPALVRPAMPAAPGGSGSRRSPVGAEARGAASGAARGAVRSRGVDAWLDRSAMG